uniref:Uncharacterized protein n=1 Tax=Globodera rostochiensis TaxID=31243 RepID=A0A914H8T9_GLORO
MEARFAERVIDLLLNGVPPPPMPPPFLPQMPRSTSDAAHPPAQTTTSAKHSTGTCCEWFFGTPVFGFAQEHRHVMV